MLNYKLIVSYDGTNYHGWQIQPNGISIQELLQKALSTLTKEPVHVTGSGRTDAGVHARGQTAHFHCSKEIDTQRYMYSLNGILPKDIRILKLTSARSDFHARYSAIKKTYHYHLHLGAVEDPFSRFYSWHPHQKVDLALLREAVDELNGTHDFTTFSNVGSAGGNPVRTLQLEAIDTHDGVCLVFQSNGFLYKMVRNLTGTIIEVASGKRPISDITSLLEAKDRRLAGAAAPPHGLFLMKVDYPDDLNSFG